MRARPAHGPVSSGARRETPRSALSVLPRGSARFAVHGARTSRSRVKMQLNDGPSRFRMRGALLAGLAILAAAVLVLAVALMRASSVVLDSEHAYAWITLGAVTGAIAAISMLAPRVGDDEARLLLRASEGCMLAAAAVV